LRVLDGWPDHWPNGVAIVIDTAREVAGLDLLSGGRVILTGGTGWNRGLSASFGDSLPTDLEGLSTQRTVVRLTS
jgi:alkanesulfonate monooxygenase SsuD/methylene tetrahydromethanopterin reductase-like flavin-dependent oxidoreductase (luciferase family)